MEDITAKLQDRLQTLQKQAGRDLAWLQDNAPEGEAVYSKIIDSLASALHNLPGSQAVQESGG